MIYESAKPEELHDVYNVVQHTIKTIYPKYYPMEVVDFFCGHHSKASIERDIKNGYVSVLKIDGDIVATGCFVDNHITRVYVLPEYQKNGYGTFIIKNIEAQISEKYDKAYLDASLPAAALYEKLGFSTIRHESYPVENGVILTYEVMEKKINRISADINYVRRKFMPKMNYVSTKFEYKKATIKDIDELVQTRIIVLRAANKLSSDEDMSKVEQESYVYYKRALESGEHAAYLVYDNGKFIGAGGVSFYQIMPTYSYSYGQKGLYYEYVYCTGISQAGNCISHIGFAGKCCEEAGRIADSIRGDRYGTAIYEKYGFVRMQDEMELV